MTSPLPKVIGRLKRFRFDSQRSATSLEHLVRNHTEGPQIEFCHQHGMEAMLVLRKLSGESDPVGGLDA